MATVELTCARDSCGRTFERSIAEHNRSVRLGRSEYCSQSCQVRSGNEGRVNLQRGRGEWRDEFSPLRSYMRSIRRRDPNTDLTLAYLKELWDAQAGRCALSGVELRLPDTSAGQGAATPQTASVDRIDPAKGYQQGNVRWLSYIANIARNGFTDDDVRAFAAAVVVHSAPR